MRQEKQRKDHITDRANRKKSQNDRPPCEHFKEGIRKTDGGVKVMKSTQCARMETSR